MLGHRHTSSNKSGWAPGLDEAVNKRFLSTGETEEFAGENVEFGLNPGVGRAVPQNLSSKWRERATREDVRNVGDMDEGDCPRCCQQNSRSELGQKGSGSPSWTTLELLWQKTASTLTDKNPLLRITSRRKQTTDP